MKPSRPVSNRDSGKIVAALVRERSKTGCLVSREEIYLELIGQGIFTQQADEEKRKSLEGAIRGAIKENTDLREVSVENGDFFYYSTEFMSEPYVRILLRRRGNPLVLIAETVRENSASNPRPVPLDAFKNIPFEQTEEKIIESLKKMEKMAEYWDIARTVTSAGTVFLYSISYLEPDYAAMLAEWLDVGQFENP